MKIFETVFECTWASELLY